jgi:hypothetical protein
MINELLDKLNEYPFKIIYYFFSIWFVFYVPDYLSKLIVYNYLIDGGFYLQNTICMFLISLICFFCILIGIVKKLKADDSLSYVLTPLALVSFFFLFGCFLVLEYYNFIFMISIVGIEFCILYLLDKLIKIKN